MLKVLKFFTVTSLRFPMFFIPQVKYPEVSFQMMHIQMFWVMKYENVSAFRPHYYLVGEGTWRLLSWSLASE